MSDNPPQKTDSPASAARHIDSREAFDHLLADEERVLVDFHAEWCAICKIMAPTIDEFAAETSAEVVKVDIETLEEVATRYDVESVPTFMGFRDGEPSGRLMGLQRKASLAETVE